MNTQMWCAVVAEGSSIENDTETNLCKCINECKMLSFATAISSSQMSTKSILNEIVDASDVPQRFIAAIETRNRVDASLMMSTVSLLTRTAAAQRRLRDLINFRVVSPGTSLTTEKSKFLASLGDMIRGHVNDSLQLVSIARGVYSKHVDYLATGLTTQLRDCDSLTAEVHVIAIRTQSTWITDAEKDRLKLLRDRFKYLRTTLADFNSLLDKEAHSSAYQCHYFPKQLLVGDCNTAFQSVNKSMQYQINWLDSLITNVQSSIIAPVESVIFTNLTNLRSNMTKLSDCLMSYKTHLDSFEHQLNLMATSTLRSDFGYEAPVTLLSDFQSGGQWLDSLTVRYLGNSLSKKMLAETIDDNGDSRVINPAIWLYYDIETSLFTKISDLLEKQEELMVSFYCDLLQRVNTLHSYMFTNDTKLEEFARRLSIWRMPIANFQTAKVSLLSPVAQ